MHRTYGDGGLEDQGSFSQCMWSRTCPGCRMSASMVVRWRVVVSSFSPEGDVVPVLPLSLAHYLILERNSPSMRRDIVDSYRIG